MTTTAPPELQLIEMRAALFALFAVARRVPKDVCGPTLDAATAWAAELDAAMLGLDDPAQATRARIGAARLLNSLCGACRACPRGVTGETPIMTHPRPAA